MILYSNLFGIIPKKLKHGTCCGNSPLDPQSISPLEKSSIFPVYSWKIKIFPQSVCHGVLDQFISTFNDSDRNHSVKFQDLKLITKNSPHKLFGNVQYVTT